MAVEAKTDPAARAQTLVEFETPAPLERPLAMPDIYKDFMVYDLTTQMEDRRYMARTGERLTPSGKRTGALRNSLHALQRD